MRGRSRAHKLTSQAERNGAIRCAPRELALAKSHLEFAAVELDQGFVSRANQHLAIAEPNAHAATIFRRRERAPSAASSTAARPEDPDTDGDGISDSRDMCVLEPEDKDGYLDDDGCPELDNDLDGIADRDGQVPERARGSRRLRRSGRLPRSRQRQGHASPTRRSVPERARSRGRRQPGARASRSSS
jgi:hypothetical protein